MSSVFLFQLKAHYKKSPGLHTFARLMDLLNDPNANGSNSGAVDGYSTAGHEHDISNKEKPSRVRGTDGT